MLYNKMVVNFSERKGDLASNQVNSFVPGAHNVSFDMVPSYPDGINTKEDLKAYFEEVMEPLVNAGWSIKVTID
jgi:hypothetical protein